MKIRVTAEERERLVAGTPASFPKYTTQILNTANQNAQGTRPRVVGPMSEIRKQFRIRHPYGSYDDWVEFYYREHDGEQAIQDATDRVCDMVQKMVRAGGTIDREMAQHWVEDLVLYKTYLGIDLQEAILKKVGEVYGLPWRHGSQEEEGRGIDGYIGTQPVSVKPNTYKQMAGLPERIDVPIVFYKENTSNTGFTIDTDALDSILRRTG